MVQKDLSTGIKMLLKNICIKVKTDFIIQCDFGFGQSILLMCVSFISSAPQGHNYCAI